MWLISAGSWAPEYSTWNWGRLYSDLTGCAGALQATAMGAGPSHRGKERKRTLTCGRLIPKEEEEKQGSAMRAQLPLSSPPIRSSCFLPTMEGWVRYSKSWGVLMLMEYSPWGGRYHQGQPRFSLTLWKVLPCWWSRGHTDIGHQGHGWI